MQRTGWQEVKRNKDITKCIRFDYVKLHRGTKKDWTEFPRRKNKKESFSGKIRRTCQCSYKLYWQS